MPPAISRRKFGFALAVFVRGTTIMGRQPANASGIHSPRPIDSSYTELARFRGVRPQFCLSNSLHCQPSRAPFIRNWFLHHRPNSRVPLCILRCVRFFPFRLALLRASTMRPAPLAPSAFPAPPKEFPFQIVRSAHCGPRLNSPGPPRNASASGFGSMRHSLFRAQATGTERTFHL